MTVTPHGSIEHERAPTDSALPRRTVITTTNYEEAERAVDFLSDARFPVERIRIVGTGLHSVEDVAGRLTTGRAAALGAARGAVFGILFALGFSWFFAIDVADFWAILPFSILTGALTIGLFEALLHLAQRGRHDYASVTATQADQYEVQVENGFADRAASLLERLPGAP